MKNKTNKTFVKYYGTYVDCNGHKHHTVNSYNMTTRMISSTRDIFFIKKKEVDKVERPTNFDVGIIEAAFKTAEHLLKTHVCFYAKPVKKAIELHEIFIKTDGGLCDAVIEVHDTSSPYFKTLNGCANDEAVMLDIYCKIKCKIK